MYWLDFLIVLGLLQGIVVSVVILSSKVFQDKANRLIAYFLAMLAIIGLDFWFKPFYASIQHRGWLLLVDVLGDDIPWVMLLYVPLYLFFARASGQRLPPWGKPAILCVPFLVFLLLNALIDLDMDFGVLHAPSLVAHRHIVYVLEDYLALAYAIGLCGASYRMAAGRVLAGARRRWLRRLWWQSALLVLLWLLLMFTPAGYGSLMAGFDYLLWLFVSVFVHWLIYTGLFHLNLSNNRATLHTLLEAQDAATPRGQYGSGPQQTTKVGGPHYQKLLALMEEEHLYRDPDLGRESVADKLGISPSYTTQIIKAQANTSFTAFINRYRVADAQRMLADPAFARYDVLSVGLESGFKSKSAFYQTFKGQLGLTPSQFRKKKS